MAVAAALAAAPAADADAATVAAFRAFVDGGSLHYEVTVCARVGSRVRFTTRLDARGGRTYFLAPRTGRQQHPCPTWRYAEQARFPPGRYTTSVRVTVDDARLNTRRVAIVLP